MYLVHDAYVCLQAWFVWVLEGEEWEGREGEGSDIYYGPPVVYIWGINFSCTYTKSCTGTGLFT